MQVMSKYSLLDLHIIVLYFDCQGIFSEGDKRNYFWERMLIVDDELSELELSLVKR